MFNELNALQTGAAILFFTALFLFAIGLCYLGYKEIMKTPKERKRDISFSDIHKILSENEIAFIQSIQHLNDYKS